MGLGSLRPLEVWPTPPPNPAWGLRKSYDSQAETNSIIKSKIRAAFLHANWWYLFALWDCKWEPPKLQFKISPVEWTRYPEPFSNRDSRLLLLLSALFKTGCWLARGKASACNARDLGLIPGSGRSPGEGNDNPLQYCCLENPMGGKAW